MLEQPCRIVGRAEDGFCHAVMQNTRDRLPVEGTARVQKEQRPALYAANPREAAIPGDVGRLRGPGRNRAKARHHEQRLAARRLRRLAVPDHLPPNPPPPPTTPPPPFAPM